MTAPTPASLAVKEELSALVRREYDHVRHFYEKLWSFRLDRRVRMGRAVANLRFDRVVNPSRGVARFHCPVNESRFRAGDLLRLSRNVPAGPAHHAVTWYGEDEDWAAVVFNRPGHLQAFLQDDPGSGTWTLDESYLDLQWLYESAFDHLTASALGRDQVAPILAGILGADVDLAVFDQAAEATGHRPMNTSQQEAAAMAIAAHPFALIQGPPGTGKTRTLAVVAEALVQRGERVLVTALTHRAIHEALNKICEFVSADLVAKIGLPVYDPGLVPKDHASFRECPLSEATGGYVVGATPFSLWTRRLNEVTFDTIILDEASQVTPALAALAMLKGNRYLFVGDHQQLPPVLSHQPLSPEGVDASPKSAGIFQRLHDQASSTLLTTCYRMNATLCDWPSEQFYQGRLVPAEANAGRRLGWPGDAPPAMTAWGSCDDAASVWIRLDAGDCTTESLEEAALVGELIAAWIDAGQAAEALGVVVPYRRQANRIRRQLRNPRRFPEGTARKVAVDTVERFQGSEREAMILSFTASDPAFVERQAGFLFQPQRLNVAVTRARSKRILLVSEGMIEAAKRLHAGDHEAAGIFLSLLDNATPLHGQAHP